MVPGEGDARVWAWCLSGLDFLVPRVGSFSLLTSILHPTLPQGLDWNCSMWIVTFMEISRCHNIAIRRMTDCPSISLGVLMLTVYSAVGNWSR